MRNFKEKVIEYKTPVIYTGSSIIKSFASVFTSFVIAKYVTPDDLGLWATISLAQTYSIFLLSGVINGLNLELPFAYGKGNIKEAEELASVSQTYILIISLILLLSGLCITFIFPFQEEKVKWGVFAIVFVICFSFYQSYLFSTFRSKDAFLKLSSIQLVDAFINIGSLILIIYYAYYGMIIKAVLVIFIDVILLHIFRPIKVRLYWNRKILSNLLKVGFPIFILAYIDTVASTFDKLWLLKFSDLNRVC